MNYLLRKKYFSFAIFRVTRAYFLVTIMQGELLKKRILLKAADQLIRLRLSRNQSISSFYQDHMFYKKLLLALALLPLSLLHVSAAEVTILSPEKALANRQPIHVLVFLDTGKDTVSGLSGNFSFPSDMFTIGSIELESSVVSLWVQQPRVSEEKYLDNRTHVTFEGIFPGGYDGVRSPYYSGKKSGILFSLTLIPKNKGTGSLIVDDIVLNRFDYDATPIETASVVKTIVVPELLPGGELLSLMRRVERPTLSAFITRDPLINNNSWYLIVDETQVKSSINQIRVAETDDYTAELVNESMWRTIKIPYVLLSQERTKFIHIKIIYYDNTYTTLSLPPVENSKNIVTISRILISVITIVIVAALFYFYGKSIFTLFKKQQ